MKKLSKVQVKQFNETVEAIRDSQEEINLAIQEYNTLLEEKWAAIEAAKEKHNTAIDDAISFVESISSEMNDYFDERSDKWQESDKGDSYREWIEQWECLELEPCDLEQPEPLEEFESDAVGILEELKTELDG